MHSPRQARWLKLDVVSFWHRQQFGNAFLPARDPLILCDREQHVRWAPPIRDKNGTASGGPLCSARFLVKFSAGQFGNAHLVRNLNVEK